MQNSISIEDTITVVRNFLRVGKINEAVENLQIILDSRDITERHEIIVDILNIRVLMELGQIEEATALVEASSYGLQPDRFKPEFIEIQTLKAILYFLSSKINESELILTKALSNLEKFNETDKTLCEESISEINNLLGLMLSNNGEWNEAYLEFQKALAYRKRVNHRKEMGMIYYNIANVYRFQQKSQLSLSTLEEAIRTFKDIDYVEGLEASYNTIKEVYAETGETDTAFLYKQKLDELSERINFKNYVKETA
ncbi:MAG: tetratricopeptide repeat protein, partial [Candidatus Heimdallarchaeota archaeon]